MNAKNIAKVFIVVLAGVLVWMSFSHKRPLTPLEQKVEDELRSSTVPVRYSDGSWSVIGLQKQISLGTATSGDAFMVRGIVVREVEPCVCPQGALCSPCAPRGIGIADKPLGQVLFVRIREGEELLFKKGVSVALQIRVGNGNASSTPYFETF